MLAWPFKKDPKHVYPLGYEPGLDGLRGFAVLGIMLVHSNFHFRAAKYFMDVFFVLSGYLITSLLIADYQKNGTLNFKRFYIRRISRLYPALVTLLFTILILSYFFSNEFWLRVVDVGVALFYISDYWHAFNGPGISYTIHTWSLAIEEQFYLIWPWIFLGLMKWLKVSWRTVIAIFVLAIFCWVWRSWLNYHGASTDRLEFSFDTRADSLFIGCMLAVILKIYDLSKAPRLCNLLAWSLLPLILLGLFLIKMHVIDHDARFYFYVSLIMVSIPTAIAIAAITQPKRIFIHALFDFPFLVLCGRISYGLYLWHYPLFKMFFLQFGFTSKGVFLIGWPIAFALAGASYYLIERHFMRFRPL